MKTRKRFLDMSLAPSFAAGLKTDHQHCKKPGELRRPKPLFSALLAAGLLLLVIDPGSLRAAPLGTAFTYQGKLAESGGPANGLYDFTFSLYDAATGGASVGPVLTNNAVSVSGGLFTVSLDFGAGMFSGNACWLGIGVRTNAAGMFTTLTPRQALNPTPYAHFAMTPAGPQGPKGDTGSAGATGPQGPQGPNTTMDNTLYIGSDHAKTQPNSTVLLGTDGEPILTLLRSGAEAGFVGINTNHPQTALHVNGTITASSFASPVIGAGQEPDDSTPGRSVTVQGGHASPSGYVAQPGGSVIVQAGNSFNVSYPPYHGGDVVLRSGANWLRANDRNMDGGDIVFETGGSSNTFTECARIVGATGYVGIGTASPQATLDIVGANPYPHLRIAAASNAPYGTFLQLDATATENGKQYHIFSTGGSAGEGQSKLVFQDFTDHRIIMCMTSNGNVGIGTVNPGYTLEVKGTVAAASFEGDGRGITNVPGVLRWQVVPGSSVQAQPNHGYLLNNAAQTVATLPPNPEVGDIVRVTGAGGGWKIIQNSGQSIRSYGGGLSAPVGLSWTARASNQAWASVASSADGTKLVAADDGGQIWTSTDSGVNWTARADSQYWTSVASSADGTKLAASVYAGQIWTSTDSGVNWTARADNRKWYDVASSADGTKLVAVVWTGQIWTSTDSGVNWTAHADNRNWNAVASSADGTKLVAVVYGGGQIWTSTSASVSATTSGEAGCLVGGELSTIELQYIGNGRFVPLSLQGPIFVY